MKKQKKNIALSVKNISISYKELKKISIVKLLNIFRKPFDSFTAVKNVNFELEKGKILGIVGKNGSGKSTMLGAIAGIYAPDNGTIDLHNNTVSLLSIGVGFYPNLTGAENIYLSGMLFGFDKAYIKSKFDEIVEFADIGEFIYKPVSTYSSGMYSKLAFSITAILETDIMLIDEILSVGDIQFQQKSYNKMKELISNENKTVIIVSHNLDALEELCTDVLWIHEGEMKMFGKPRDVLVSYAKFMIENEKQ